MKTCRKFLPAISVAIATALTQAGCAVAVRTDFDRDADFSSYETFDWLEPPQRASSAAQSDSQDPFSSNSLLDKRLRAAVERVLDVRGFRKSTMPPAATRARRYLLVSAHEEEAST